MNRNHLWLAILCAAAFLVPAAVPASPAPARTLDALQDTSGKAIFEGKGICHVCHGPDAKGTPLAPNLTDAEWLHSDGSLDGITKTIKAGVASPKKHPAPMPPLGGAQLTDAEVQAVARYVFSLSPTSKPK
jgi:cbb3-type cytochrome c oxidase subunit III